MDIFESQLISARKDLDRYAFTLLKDKNKIQDLIQDTIVKALENRSKYEDKGNIKPWLFTIMHNIFCSNYRRKIEYLTSYTDTPELYSEKIVYNEADRRLDSRDVDIIIGQLPSAKATALRLSIDDYTAKESAAILGEHHYAIKTRCYEAKKDVKKIIEGTYTPKPAKAEKVKLPRKERDGKPVTRYTLSGEELNTFDSGIIAAAEHGVSRSKICRAAAKGTVSAGFLWKKKEVAC